MARWWVEEKAKLSDCYLDMEGHGGGCCGRAHLYDFPDLDECKRTTSKERVDFILNRIHSSYRGGMGVEVVLNEEQLPQWRGAVTKAGFKQVFKFRNKNSGLMCHVFMLDTTGMS